MICIIVGTDRKQSVSSQVAQIYQRMLTDKGVDSTILTLEDLPPDYMTTSLYENAGKNATFNQAFVGPVSAFDKFIFIVPEYNGSFPGILKSFIDGLPYPNPFRDKKAALVGISSGVQGAGLALSHLTDILNYLGMHVIAQKPKLARIEKHMEDTTIINPLYMDLLNEQAEAFIAF